MPRARVVRPEFWSDEKIGSLSLLERLLFIGMWTFSDDEGLCRSNPMYLRSAVFPYDNIKEKEIDNALNSLQKKDMIFLYQNNRQKYSWIIKFRIYQKIDRPQKAQNPSPRFEDPKFKQAIFKRDGLKCYLCGKQLEYKEFYIKGESRHFDDDTPSVDHIVARSKGGDDYPTNLKTACLKCNKSKSSKNLSDLSIIRGSLDEDSSNCRDQIEIEEEVKRRKTETLRAHAREGEGVESDFSKFWTAYPKKVGKIKAEESWNKQNGKRPPIDAILSKIEKLKKTRQWQKDGGQFIPNPTTWINQGRWDDELESADECPGFDWSKP